MNIGFFLLCALFTALDNAMCTAGDRMGDCEDGVHTQML